MKRKEYIESNKSIMGGKPVIVGTRIPVSRLLYLLSQGYTFGEVQEEYPQLTVKTIAGVVGTIAEKADQDIYYQPAP